MSGGGLFLVLSLYFCLLAFVWGFIVFPGQSCVNLNSINLINLQCENRKDSVDCRRYLTC